MKYIKYFTAICITIFIASCAQDKGNYTYSELNDIVISKINDGKIIDCVPSETINIKGVFSRKKDQSTDKLSYIWTINRDTVSTNKDLEYIIPAVTPFGSITGRYSVIDDTNKMHYSQSFTINIRCQFNYGYYMLCKEPNNSSRIYFLPSRNKDAGEDREEKVISTSKIGDSELGPNPYQVTGIFKKIPEINDNAWVLYFATSGNNNNIISTSSATMLPRQIYNSNSFSDDQNRELNSPEILFDYPGTSYLVANGKIMSIIEQYLYRPAKHKKDYYWSNTLSVWNNVTAALDRLTGKFHILTPEVNDPIAGVLSDKYASDKVTEVKLCPDYRNTEIIDMRFSSAIDIGFHFDITSASDKGISIDRITFNSSMYSAVFTNMVLITHPKASNKIKGVAIGDKIIDWYFIIDHELYSSPNILHKLTKLADIPKNLGDVKEIKASTELDHVVITMYNSSNSKGSLVRVWIRDGKVDVFENIMSEPISLFSADGSPWK